MSTLGGLMLIHDSGWADATELVRIRLKNLQRHQSRKHVTSDVRQWVAGENEMLN